ncbi:MAG: bifunctional UDP-N-acetylglucosamine diphosphorylase/glucosamine-1-phosphate N-acetyltransferase GlmU [Myxococcales bacterium]|nr:bifunctional UDP-N-acetylglucosamine diphosphorylase/glucosamine-1-phosphate N-acetyltransferase GlmU [Myxococcales bacterium]
MLPALRGASPPGSAGELFHRRISVRRDPGNLLSRVARCGPHRAAAIDRGGREGDISGTTGPRGRLRRWLLTRARAVVVMAAGQGTRMRSQRAKVLHTVAGRPMIHYPVRSALALGAERVVVIVGHQREAVEAYLAQAFVGAPVVTAVQEEQRGTAHAVECARDALAGFAGDVFILSGDVPTLPNALIERLDAETGAATLGLLSMRLPDPAAYGRIVRDDADVVQRIVEFRDASDDEKKIDEVNAGIYRVDARFLFTELRAVGTDNAQGEYYLTDLVAAAAKAGGARAVVLTGDEAAQAAGVNDRLDLAAAERRMQAHLRAELMRAGVTLVDPARFFVHDGVEIGADTVIEPDVALLGNTRIGADCVLEQGSRIADSEVAEGALIRAMCHLEGAKVGPRCQVGPFARLREGTVLHAKVKVGNFVETKKAELFEGAKASHLSYLGDASVGAGANIGAGTITCNYDGVRKHRTEIGAGAFIGSDTQLVAPVTVGEGAYVGAGSTVTYDVPQDALALSRMRQRNIDGWAARKREADALRED